MKPMADRLMFSPCRPLILPLLMVATSLHCWDAAADDWPQWHGPNRNAKSEEQGLLQQWPEHGPPLAWRVDGLGGGDSAPAVAEGKLFGMSHRDGKEVAWALSEADGKELWLTPLGDAVEQGMSQSKEGPGGTPTVDGDRLYIIGMGGRIACLEAQDGRVVWERSLTKDFGGVVPPWSYRESPLVDGDKLICTPGSPEALVVALDKHTGETIWQTKLPAEAANPETTPEATPAEGEGERSQPGRSRGGRRGRFGGGRGFGGGGGAAYSSAIAIDFEGERQYVQFTAKSLVGVAASDGRLLWQYNRPANGMGINCSTPIHQDGLVFASSAYGAGGGAVKLVKEASGEIKPEEVYSTNQMQNHHGGMIVVDGCLYGANGGNGGGFLGCLDFQTGETLWRDRNAPKGSLAFAGGRLYLRDENGALLLIEPSREKFLERGRFDQPDRSSSPAWAHPVVANGKLYIRDQGLLLCYDIESK